jgi:Cu-Zn family superoxide dismutase
MPCDAPVTLNGPFRLFRTELHANHHLRIPVCVVRGDSKITGTVTFEQASESAPTTVSWDITGQDASAKRGMHIHTFGDNTNGCTSAGPHCASRKHTHDVHDEA